MNWLKRPASETQVTHGQRLWLYVLAGVIMVLLVAPTLIVIPMSFSDSQYLQFPPRGWSLRWYKGFFDSPGWMDAARTSLTVAVLTMLVATPLGTAAAYGLYASGHKWARVVFLLMIMPIMIPVVLVAIGAFYAFVQLGLVNSLLGLVVAHSILALPLVVIVVSSALKSYDIWQEMAARNLGASRLKAFMMVTLPQIRFSAITAGLLAFLTSFDEVVVALFVSGGQHSTLTRNMFNALRDQIDPTIAAISTIMILVSTILLVVAQIVNKPED